MFKTAAAVTLTILIAYGVLKAVPLLLGPDIKLDSPVEGQTAGDGFMTISGRAVHTQDLTLNGAPFLIDEKGRFQTTILVPPGGAILTLSATDRFGRRASIERTVFVP